MNRVSILGLLWLLGGMVQTLPAQLAESESALLPQPTIQFYSKRLNRALASETARLLMEQFPEVKFSPGVNNFIYFRTDKASYQQIMAAIEIVEQHAGDTAATLDEVLPVQMVYLKHARASEVRSMLGDLMMIERGQVSVDERINGLAIRVADDKYREILQWIKEIDQPTDSRDSFWRRASPSVLEEQLRADNHAVEDALRGFDLQMEATELPQSTAEINREIDRVKKIQREVELAIRKLCGEIASAGGTDKESGKEVLQLLVESAFDVRQRLQKLQIAQQNVRLSHLAQRVEDRQNKRETIVRERVDQLLQSTDAAVDELGSVELEVNPLLDTMVLRGSKEDVNRASEIIEKIYAAASEAEEKTETTSDGFSESDADSIRDSEAELDADNELRPNANSESDRF